MALAERASLPRGPGASGAPGDFKSRVGHSASPPTLPNSPAWGRAAKDVCLSSCDRPRRGGLSGNSPNVLGAVHGYLECSGFPMLVGATWEPPGCQRGGARKRPRCSEKSAPSEAAVFGSVALCGDGGGGDGGSSRLPPPRRQCRGCLARSPAFHRSSEDDGTCVLRSRPPTDPPDHVASHNTAATAAAAPRR
ncbi:unnamed protein product [Lampetra fluviatilis]